MTSSATLKPSAMELVPGRIPRTNTKSAAMNTALANSGTEVVEMQVMDIDRSSFEPSRIPARMPSPRDKGTMIASA